MTHLYNNFINEYQVNLLILKGIMIHNTHPKLNNSPFNKTCITVTSKDYVIENRYVQQFACFYKFLGDIDILVGRFGVATRMIMH
jgi:hypothetical protein